MTTLDILQHKANYWAVKLDVGPVRVGWLDRCPDTREGSRAALGESDRFDAHCHKREPTRGIICVSAHVGYWRGPHRVHYLSHLMRHEVAHLVGKGKHGTKAFMAAAGEKPHQHLLGIYEKAPWAYNGRLWRTGGIYTELAKAGVTELVKIRRIP